MKMIYAIEQLPKKEDTWVFLGGPIQGAPEWQETVPDIQGVTWINPRRKEKISGGLSDAEYKKQVDWETIGLRVSDFILFWIPEAVEDIPGRDYAQTTKIELTENLVRKKNIILGIAPKIHGRRYLIEKAKAYGIKNVYSSLDECISELKKEISNRESSSREFFTSDTHFGAERTLELSKRPFMNVEDMDWTMVERWNTKVPPKAIVWHLGDFGDRSYLKYLNGDIQLVCGNYEIKEKSERNLDIPDFIGELIDSGFSKVFLTEAETKLLGKEIALVHEPMNSTKKYNLFGHIHGRQMIKRFGLDVGVDVHGFAPMSAEEVEFFLNALEKGYYDAEVFC